MSSESIAEYKIILASNSSIRKKILEDSGISFEVIASDVDEEELKKSFSSKNFKDNCLALAKAKALEVSNKQKNAYVIGSDQMSNASNSIDNEKLIEINESIRFHSIEIIGDELRQHMTSMKKAL